MFVSDALGACVSEEVEQIGPELLLRTLLLKETLPVVSVKTVLIPSEGGISMACLVRVSRHSPLLDQGPGC